MVYLCSTKENRMNFDEFYRALERLKKDGEIVNAYGGSEKDVDHPAGSVLNDIMEHICEKYPNERPMWMEAFYQVFNWQYAQCMRVWRGTTIIFTEIPIIVKLPRLRSF